ncbi:MAG TPA: hypothetical protein VKV80_21660 [Streptosporangiaceae bacterium]|nr:hypothetical protein [Streptosporangiaceae bacterium]
MHSIETRLGRIRGKLPPRHHTARTIAALTSNPGCARRAVMDAAGVDKQRLAAHAGFPAPFGQSRFALARGNAFEAQVKANGAAELLTLLREHLRLPIPEAHYDDLGEVGGNASRELRYARTRSLLARAHACGDDAGTMFDHPLLRLDVGGRAAYLEPDLLAFRLREKFHVVEIKSFPVIDGQADGEKVAAAAIQSAVYVLALRAMLAEMGIGPDAVADETILVCPENFSNRPAAASLDVRKQLTVLRRQLSRLERIENLLELLPPDLTFDLEPGEDGTPTRPPGDLAAAIRRVEARYAPECLSTCEMCFFCRDEAHAATARLGRDTLDDLGGVEHIAQVLSLARGADVTAAPEMAEAAGLLAAAARLRGECLGEAV